MPQTPPPSEHGEEEVERETEQKEGEGEPAEGEREESKPQTPKEGTRRFLFQCDASLSPLCNINSFLILHTYYTSNNKL